MDWYDFISLRDGFEGVSSLRERTSSSANGHSDKSISHPTTQHLT